MSDSATTTDHKVIKKWAEERAGQPATVRATEEDGHAGILRIDSGPMEGQLEEIEWAEFFASSTSPVSRFCIKTAPRTENWAGFTSSCDANELCL